jgi:hypothetical protein
MAMTALPGGRTVILEHYERRIFCCIDPSKTGEWQAVTSRQDSRPVRFGGNHPRRRSAAKATLQHTERCTGEPS